MCSSDLPFRAIVIDLSVIELVRLTRRKEVMLTKKVVQYVFAVARVPNVLII